MNGQVAMSDEYRSLAGLIQSMVNKLETKFDDLDKKVDRLMEDHVTRADIDTLRREMGASYVQRDLYETRHTAVIARVASVESSLAQLNTNAQGAYQRLHDRLESGKQQIEDRFSIHAQQIDQRFKEQQKDSLSEKDRRWMQWFYVISGFAAIVSVVSLLTGHISFR